jgi:hypothetical protein
VRPGKSVPSADEVAWAIVQAGREFGYSNRHIVAIAQRENGRCNARHYALHALLAVFPDANRGVCARLVGCRSDPEKFYDNSYYRFARIVNGRRAAPWWDEDEFARVVGAVQAAAVVTPDPVRDVEPAELEPPRRPIKLSAAVGGIVEPTRPAAAPGKRKLEDILREAVLNTQRMTPPAEE